MLGLHFVWSLWLAAGPKTVQRIMAHRLNVQMYVNEIEFEVMIMEKLIDLVFSEMVNRKIQQL